MNKKEIYAAAGIEEKGGKILSPFNTWIPELIPIGTNTKVGNAGTWSVYHGNETRPASEFGPQCQKELNAAGVTSITGSCPVHCKGCYCDAGRFNFDSVKAGNIRKLLIAKMYPEYMIAAISAQIIADGLAQIRIHAAGDFFSKEYAAAWKTIAINNPGVTFWTYTKNADALQLFADVPNVSIVPSLTPAGINFGTCAELLAKYTELPAAGYRVHICACGTECEKHCSDCAMGCKAIGTNCDYVLFIKHSAPDYKAGEKDPAEYAAIKEIIRNQDN